MANYRKSNPSSSSATQMRDNNTSAQYVNVQSSGTSTTSETSLYAELFKNCMNDIAEIKKRVEAIEQDSSNSKHSNSDIKDFIKLAQTARIAIIFLICVPALQLLFCAIVVYSLGIENQLPNILKWFLGGISVASLIEMIMFPIKMFSDANKIADLEKRIEKCETKQDRQ